jgi:hypothetical protein
MNPDFVDLLRAFVAADVRFLIVGGFHRAPPVTNAQPAVQRTSETLKG